MTEMSGLNREVAPQGKAKGVSPWYGVHIDQVCSVHN